MYVRGGQRGTRDMSHTDTIGTKFRGAATYARGGDTSSSGMTTARQIDPRWNDLDMEVDPPPVFNNRAEIENGDIRDR